MQPSYEHTHPSITSAVPLGCNNELRNKLIAHVAACVKLGMVNTLPNILMVTKFWHEGYSPECAVRFFGLGVAPITTPKTTKRTSHSASIAEFSACIMALAKTGQLVVDRPSADCAIFSHNGREIGIILTVNGVQDRVLYSYDS